MLRASRGPSAILFLVLSAASLPGVVASQGWPRADSLHVSVTLDSVAVNGSSATPWMSVAVRGDSRQPLWRLVVERRVVVTRVVGPARFRSMVATVDGHPAVFWAGAGGRVEPGERRSGFAYSGDGMPAIVSFWAQGYYPPPEASPATEELASRPPIEANSFRGETVGLEPVAEQAPGALLTRTVQLATAACQLGWITHEGVCHSLRVKLDQANAALGRGAVEVARGQVRAFLDELHAQHGPEPGKHVTDNAYWLLKINVEYLMSRL